VAFVPLGFDRIPLRAGAVPEEVQVDMVSGNFFSGLGVAAARGRTFTMDDESTHAPIGVTHFGQSQVGKSIHRRDAELRLCRAVARRLGGDFLAHIHEAVHARLA